MFLTFTPPINILPSVTSANLAISLASVVFPPPEGPTNATCSPAFILRLTSCSASFTAPGYLNETFSNVIDVSAGCFLSAVCSNGFLSMNTVNSRKCVLNNHCILACIHHLCKCDCNNRRNNYIKHQIQ